MLYLVFILICNNFLAVPFHHQAPGTAAYSLVNIIPGDFGETEEVEIISKILVPAVTK